MSSIGPEGKCVQSRRLDFSGLGVQVSELRDPAEVFRPPWEMSYAELCSQPIVLYRAKHTEAKVTGGLNWTQELASIMPYSNVGRGYVGRVIFHEPTELATLIADDSWLKWFHLSRPPENVNPVSREEMEARNEIVLAYQSKGIPEKVLFPLAHKKLSDGKRVVYKPLTLWMYGIELALKNGEVIQSDILEEYELVKRLGKDRIAFEQYEAEHNQFEKQ